MNAIKVPKTKMKTKPVLLTRIPISVHSHFKAACAKKGKSMLQEIIQFMKDYAKKYL
jgi:hypothetical protein